MAATSANPADIESRERDFHDDWAASIDIDAVRVEESFTGSTSPEGAWIVRQLGDVSGLELLELGSGAGEGAVFFAKRGARVTATDLSPGMLEVVQRLAARHGTSVETVATSAEDLSAFPDARFDIVYCANLMHHVNIAKCVAEAHRVLKPGGRIAFWDPVEYNPVINVYRKMAMNVRTIDEHPIRVHDLRLVRSTFADVKLRFFWLTSLAIFLKFYLVDRIHPSSDRYWKLVVTEEQSIRPIMKPLMAIDRILLTIFPPLGWWCWNVAVVARK